MGSSPSSATLLLLFAFCLSLPTLSPATDLKGVDIENPALEVIPAPLSGHSVVPGSKDVLFCERARVSGVSRLKLGSYASSLKITLSPSLVIPERLHSKIRVCFHRNNTLGLCQCEEDDWKNLQKGLWSSVMSPYDEKYVDVKFIGKIPGSVNITVEENFQRWRLVCLALGFTFLLSAPIVSTWVSIFLLVGIILAGAALGSWIVRKFVVSNGGTVDVGIAQFVKRAMRIIGTASILLVFSRTPFGCS